MPMESRIVKVRNDLLTQVIKGQWREVLCWTCYLQATKNWPVMWRLGTAYAPVSMRWYCSGSWEKETRQNVVSQPWTSGEQTDLPQEGDLFGRSQQNKVLEREGVWKRFSRITSSKLKSGPFQQAGNQAKATGALQGWTRRSWLNVNIERKC